MLVEGQQVWTHHLLPGVHREVRVEGHCACLLEAIRKQNEVTQSRLEHFQSLPPPPEVEHRDLRVYDKLLEEEK